jgi:hypothetical protein
MINAIQAAIDFLENDEARDLMGLHKIRVGSVMMTRGEVADLLRVAVIMGKAAKQVPPTIYPEKREQYLTRLFLKTEGMSPELLKYCRARVMFVYPELDPAEQYRAGKWLEVTSKQLR